MAVPERLCQRLEEEARAVFVVVSRRPEFSREWATVLYRWGGVRHVHEMPAVQAALGQKAPSLIIADARLAAVIHPALIQDWLRLCGNTRLLLGDTTLAPLEELSLLAAGAVACCAGSLQRDELEGIVGVVLRGGVWVSKASIPLLMSKLQAFSSPAPVAAEPAMAAADRLDGLTGRQREVARMVSEGASNKQIARALDISDRTVKAHLTSIFEKLGLSDRLQLALHVTGNRHDAHP